MAARFFLGVGEASIAPGFALITGMFYKREEQPARQAAWFIGNSIATVVGGLVAYGIGLIKNDNVTNWQLLFLILGAVTSGYGFVLLAFLPDSPAKTIFFNKDEKAIALQRTLKNKTGVMDTGKFRWGQVLMAIKDPQTWFLVLYTLCVNFCNGGITSFSSIIIAGFGFSNLKALIIQMPIGAAQLVFLVFTSGFATLVHSSRIFMMILNTAVSMIGMIMIWKLEEGDRAGKMTGLCLGAVFAANIPLSLSLISSNVAGFTKKSTVSALMFVAYCVGNIVGPQFFIPTEKPGYPVSRFDSPALRPGADLLPDWHQSSHVWLGVWYFLLDVLVYVLRLREPPARPTIWVTKTADGGRGTAGRVFQQDRPRDREFPICTLMMSLFWCEYINVTCFSLCLFGLPPPVACAMADEQILAEEVLRKIIKGFIFCAELVCSCNT